MRTLIVAATLLALCLLLVALSYAASARGLGVTAYQPVPSSEFAPLQIGLQNIPQTIPGGVVPAQTGRVETSPATSATPSPRPPRRILPTHSITGVATFYAAPTGTAAAARALRSAIGNTWRGTRVRVSYGGRSIVVVLDDWESSTIPGRLLDLSDGSFAALVGPGWYQRGVAEVSVSWQ